MADQYLDYWADWYTPLNPWLSITVMCGMWTHDPPQHELVNHWLIYIVSSPNLISLCVNINLTTQQTLICWLEKHTSLLFVLMCSKFYLNCCASEMDFPWTLWLFQSNACFFPSSVVLEHVCHSVFYVQVTEGKPGWQLEDCHDCNAESCYKQHGREPEHSTLCPAGSPHHQRSQGQRGHQCQADQRSVCLLLCSPCCLHTIIYLLSLLFS